MNKNKKRIYYDKRSDVLWLVVKSGSEEEVKEVSPGINVELDKNGGLLGIEILNASKVIGKKLSVEKTQIFATN